MKNFQFTFFISKVLVISTLLNHRQFWIEISPFRCGCAAQLFDYVVEVPTVVRHAWRAIWSDGTYPGLLRMRLLLLLVIFVVYLLSPLDLLPEAVFGVLGLLDDLLLFLLLGFSSTTCSGASLRRRPPAPPPDRAAFALVALCGSASCFAVI